MSKQYTQRSLEERQQQMKEILENLENGVKEVLNFRGCFQIVLTICRY